MFLAISLRPALFASQDKVDESTAAMQLYNTLHILIFLTTLSWDKGDINRDTSQARPSQARPSCHDTQTFQN